MIFNQGRIIEILKKSGPVPIQNVIKAFAGTDEEAMDRVRLTVREMVLCGSLNLDRNWNLVVPEEKE